MPITLKRRSGYHMRELFQIIVLWTTYKKRYAFILSLESGNKVADPLAGLVEPESLIPSLGDSWHRANFRLNRQLFVRRASKNNLKMRRIFLPQTGVIRSGADSEVSITTPCSLKWQDNFHSRFFILYDSWVLKVFQMLQTLVFIWYKEEHIQYAASAIRFV